MQVDSNYGIIPDTQDEIFQQYLTLLQNVFPNANSPDDPTYVQAFVASTFDSNNQNALQILANAVNSNTASGLGLDILASTILNLFRKKLTPSKCIIKFDVQNLLSYNDITINVTIASPPKTIPIGWAVSGGVSPSPAYATLSSYVLAASGTYVIRVFSTDITTVVPIGNVTAGAAVSGITFNSVTNLGAATLGQLVIPANWAVTASTLGNTPVYTPNQSYVYKTTGTKYMLVYSDDILTNINALALNTYPQINNLNPTPAPMIANLSNPAANVLGVNAESDAQFSARRRYYLNIEGQTYYGLEKVILNLQVPALNSLFINEVINDSYTPSIMIISVTITYSGTPVVIPVNWTVYKGAGPFPSPNYKTNAAYTYNASGTEYIPVFSTDATTAVNIGAITSGDAITGVSGVTNVSPAIFDTTIGLGQRGYEVFLDYPLNGPGGTTFDTQDIYLQQIASACFTYHPLGTQFYDAGSGTTFTVNTPYSGYTASVVLNALQISEATVTLTLTYNDNPQDAGFNNGIFPPELLSGSTLKTQLLNLINTYFRSKTLPTDMVYTITELSELIQAAYNGIVALSSPTAPFVFGTISPSSSNQLYLRRPIGYVFNLTDSNFNFTAASK